MTLDLLIALAIAVLNVLSWVAFRLDKRYARQNRRRTPERALLRLAAFGPFGALSAMYLHPHRHKVDKRAFALTVWAFALVWVAGPILWFALR